MDRRPSDAYSSRAFLAIARFDPSDEETMLRLLTRLIGLLLLAGGFIALIVDGTRSIAAGRVMVTSVNAGMSELFPGLYQSLQSSVENLSAFLWDPVLTTLMLAPVSVAFGGVGALLILVSHRRQAPLYYARR
ncbi:MAG: hypothetical protein AB7F41_13110 [Methylocystis sp.]|uniref:hypothetical protein n=1 Tax=Methylocystis sp. TaxID=1911079 RepID=UPI003D0E13A2